MSILPGDPHPAKDKEMLRDFPFFVRLFYYFQAVPVLVGEQIDQGSGERPQVAGRRQFVGLLELDEGAIGVGAEYRSLVAG